jgi:hypothetical protein
MIAIILTADELSIILIMSFSAHFMILLSDILSRAMLPLSFPLITRERISYFNHGGSGTRNGSE